MTFSSPWQEFAHFGKDCQDETGPGEENIHVSPRCVVPVENFFIFPCRGLPCDKLLEIFSSRGLATTKTSPRHGALPRNH